MYDTDGIFETEETERAFHRKIAYISEVGSTLPPDAIRQGICHIVYDLGIPYIEKPNMCMIRLDRLDFRRPQCITFIEQVYSFISSHEKQLKLKYGVADAAGK